jgi:Domain of unknown function (DUF4148)
MTHRLKLAIPLALIVVSASAMASNRLTPAECNAYPFKPLHGEVTHADLMRELAELESVGYQPGADDVEYPNDIMHAEQRLQAKYRADCGTARQSVAIQSSSN